MTISKVEFAAYVKVQMSGATNMYDTRKVEELSGLTRDSIEEIAKEYHSLSKAYPEVLLDCNL